MKQCGCKQRGVKLISDIDEKFSFEGEWKAFSCNLQLASNCFQTQCSEIVCTRSLRLAVAFAKGGGGTSSLKVWKHVEPTIATHSLCNHFHRQCHDIKPSAKAQLIKESLKVGAHTTIDTLSTYWLAQAKLGLWRRFSANSILQNANELQYHEGGFSTPWSWSTGSNVCGENPGSGISGTAGTTTHITRSDTKVLQIKGGRFRMWVRSFI